MEERLSRSLRQIGFVGFLYMVWLFRLGNGVTSKMSRILYARCRDLKAI